MGPVTFQLSEADDLAFNRLNWRTNWRKTSTIVTLIIVLPLVPALIVLAGGPHSIEIATVASAVIGAVCAAFSAAIYFLYLPHHTAKVWREYALLHESITMTGDADGFTLNQTSAHVTAPWANMVKWDEDRHVFAIHVTSQMAYVLPQSDATAAMIDFSREQLISSGLPKKGKPRK